MVYAFFMMFTNSRQHKRYIPSREYEKYKIEFSRFISENQSGEGNSQYGTCWIYNKEQDKALKIKKEEIDSYILEGWIKGRKNNEISHKEINKKPKSIKQCKLKEEAKNTKQLEKRNINLIKKQERIKLLNSYYKIYKEVGYKKFVELTGYDKTLPNLVTQFERHVKDFVPQNGKRRGT